MVLTSTSIVGFSRGTVVREFSDILYRSVISGGELSMKVLVLLDVMSTYGVLTAVHSQHHSSRCVSGGIFTMLWTYYTFKIFCLERCHVAYVAVFKSGCAESFLFYPHVGVCGGFEGWKLPVFCSGRHRDMRFLLV